MTGLVYDPPVLVNHDDVIVVRDDVLLQEAKSGSSINLSETQTVKSGSLEVQTKSVGPISLAYVCQKYGKKSTCF